MSKSNENQEDPKSQNSDSTHSTLTHLSNWLSSWWTSPTNSTAPNNAPADQAVIKDQSIVASAKNDKQEDPTRDVAYENLDDLEMQHAAADTNEQQQQKPAAGGGDLKGKVTAPEGTATQNAQNPQTQGKDIFQTPEDKNKKVNPFDEHYDTLMMMPDVKWKK